MKTKVSPAIVGVFVIGAFALCIIGLLSFGGIHFFEKPERFVVFFDESAHGLDLGSSVKLRGVRVGRVTGMSLRYRTEPLAGNALVNAIPNAAGNAPLNSRDQFVVAVVCELSRDMVTDANGAIIDISNRAKLTELVQRGLRARLEVAGLATGLLFVNLDFPDDLEATDTSIKRTTASHETYVVVPSVESPIATFQNGLSNLLAQMNKVDFPGLTKNISNLAATLRERAEGVDVRGLAEQWKRTGAQFEALGKDPAIMKTFENLNGAIAEVRTAVAKIGAQVEPTSKELGATLAEARKTMETFNTTAAAAQMFISAHAGFGEEVAGALTHLSEAADSVKRLADFLERNPNALLTGRKRPEQRP